jgi:hypothetical protein
MYFIEQSNPQKIFEKYPNIKFQENPPTGAELSLRMDGQTDRQTPRILCLSFRAS